MTSSENLLLPLHFPLSGKRIFVTGGTGFVGSEVVRQLVEQHQATVCCLVRKSSSTARWGDLSVEKVLGDLLAPDSYQEALQSCDAVIHLASLSNWNDIQSPQMPRVVVGGTRGLLEISQQGQDRPFVFVSSVTAINGTDQPEMMTEETTFSLPEKGFAYAHAKRQAEELCREFASEGKPVVVVNPSEVYGPHDDQLVTAGTLLDFLKGPVALTSHGGTSIAHVEDVAAGMIAALQRGVAGERYILGGENLSVRELAALTLRLAEKSSCLWTLPNGVVKGCAWLQKYLHLPLGANPSVIPYALKYWFVSSKKAQQQLGASFRSAEETLRPTIEWLLGR